MRAVIVPSAGSGKRFGAKKQFFTVNGKMIVEYSIEVFSKSELVDAIVLVVPEDDVEVGRKLAERYPKITKVVPGGSERQFSVFEGLKSIKGENFKEVFVHDGVRPNVSPVLLNDLVVALSDYDAHGVIPAVKPKDTVKEAGAPLERGDFIVKKTLDRDKLLLVQTPQLFIYDVLLECHERALSDDFLATDDSALLERYGYTVVAIPGDPQNIKITTKEDLKFFIISLNKNIKGEEDESVEGSVDL